MKNFLCLHLLVWDSGVNIPSGRGSQDCLLSETLFYAPRKRKTAVYTELKSAVISF